MSSSSIERRRCRSCRGTYIPKQSNYDYYHVCPDGTPDPRDENIDDSVPGRPIKKVGRGSEPVIEQDRGIL